VWYLALPITLLHGAAITTDTSWICCHVTVYIIQNLSFINLLSARKTFMQELKYVLTWNWISV
jgi:hypothetical protein